MKKANINDYWRKLPDVPIKAKGVTNLCQIYPNRQISLPIDGVFAIAGANGAGKSSFFSFLTESGYSRLPFQDHKVELHNGDLLDIPGNIIQAVKIEPIPELLRSNQSLFQFVTTFGQQGQITLKAEELRFINYVIGSSYDAIDIEEVPTSEDNVSPRFIFSTGHSTFENNSLSLGEQAVVFLYWVLTKKYTTPGVFFVEEPESGLSPAAQSRLVDLLVYVAATKAKQIFLATHSPSIVSRLGNSRVLLLKKGATAEWEPARQSGHLEELGMELGPRGIFYVEDHKAKIFLQKLLDVYSSDTRKTYDVVFLNGESNVFQVVSRVAEKAQRLKIVGILDGDQKEKTEYNNHPGHFFFLPGLLPPEQELIEAVKKNTNEYARSLSVLPSKLNSALRQCEGLDHHDFFEELSKKIFGENKNTVYEMAFNIWFCNYPNRDEIHALIRAIDIHVPSDNIQEVDNFYPPILPPAPPPSENVAA